MNTYHFSISVLRNNVRIRISGIVQAASRTIAYQKLQARYGVGTLWGSGLSEAFEAPINRATFPPSAVATLPGRSKLSPNLRHFLNIYGDTRDPSSRIVSLDIERIQDDSATRASPTGETVYLNRLRLVVWREDKEDPSTKVPYSEPIRSIADVVECVHAAEDIAAFFRIFQSPPRRTAAQ